MSGDPQAMAEAVLAAFEKQERLAPFSDGLPDLDIATGYKTTAAYRNLREARGEQAVGRKIGFTNTTIWAQYGVDAPIWGYLFDTTVKDLAEIGGRYDVARLMQPRIEPEIVFGLASAPQAGMEPADLAGCLAWIAHGFEIVQSPFPDWRFKATDSICAGGLHGALLLGPKQEVAAAERGRWAELLANFEMVLSADGVEQDRGVAANVLGSPLNALAHLAALLAEDPNNPALAPGEAITTGTVTNALPIAPGQTWSTQIEGLPLAGIGVGF